MRVYICGPITGIEDFNRPAFEAAERALVAAGHEAVNPIDNGLPVEATWVEHLRVDIRSLTTCDGIHLLDGWEKSRGARLGEHVAMVLELERVHSDGGKA